MRKKTIYRFLVMAALLAIATTAWSLVAAQDTTPEPTQQTPYLGVTIAPSDTGAAIQQVMPRSPAADAGVKTGDILTAIDDHPVTADNVVDTLGGYAVGDTVTLHVQRGDQSLELSATLAARPTASGGGQFQPRQRASRAFLGVSLQDSDAGVTVQEVVAGSPAEDAGLQVGDIITKINDTTITSARQAVSTVGSLNVGDEVTLEIKRGDATQTLTATLAAATTSQRPTMNLGFNYNPTDQSWTINQLSETSPLYDAGLRQGDVIQTFDGKAYDPMSLVQYLSGLSTDATVTVTVERDGNTQDIDIPASALSDIGGFGFGFGGRNGQGFQFPFNFNFGQASGGGRLGVQFVTLDEQAASEHKVTQTDGALVTQVADNSPAADAGLQVNDIITAVDGDKVDQEHTLRDRLVAYEPGDTITLDVIRGDQTMSIDVTLGQPEMSDFMPFFFGGPNGNGQFQPPQPAQPQQPQANL